MYNLLFVSFLFISVFISAISQVLLKKEALKPHDSKLAEYLNKNVIFAYFLFFLAIFIDMLALHRVPASFIPVIETSSYIFIIIFGKFFFNESITLKKLLGISFIISGIVIYIL